MRRALAGGLALWACVASAENPAEALLRDMHEASRSRNYDGVFVYQRGNQLDSMRIIHRFADDAESERLISLSGEPREVLRKGNEVTCLFADGSSAHADRSPPRDIIGVGFAAPVEQLQHSYNFSVVGPDRIAGRPATAILVTPLQSDRYGYKLWLDNESRLLLKSVILYDRKVLEQVEFTQFAVLDSIDPALLEPGIEGVRFDWHSDTSEANAAQKALPADFEWKVAWLPDGFQFKETNEQRMGSDTRPVRHLVYSDGLAMVSVFVEAHAGAKPGQTRRSSRGAVNALSLVTDESHQITVVGEIPPATVEKIANAVGKAQR